MARVLVVPWSIASRKSGSLIVATLPDIRADLNAIGGGRRRIVPGIGGSLGYDDPTRFSQFSETRRGRKQTRPCAGNRSIRRAQRAFGRVSPACEGGAG